MSTTILLVEDDIDLARTVMDYLELEEIQCDFAANGESGLKLALSNLYQVILLDVTLPRMDGLDVCSKLRDKAVDVPILMLTARDSIQDKLSGFDVGTDDYLVKPFDMEELVARIKALSKRRSGQVNKLTIADLELDFKNKTAQRGSQFLELSPIGWTILITLAQASPSVVSRQQLEEAIWHGDPPDSNALKVHLYRLRKKVDKPFSSSLIHTAGSHGFSLSPDEPV